jgi:acyl carrier protein
MSIQRGFPVTLTNGGNGMDGVSIEPLRSLVVEKLAARGDARPFSDRDSLFFSGRLDSLAATEIMMLLESEYGIDLADADFDVTRLDTIDDLKSLVSGRN